jgi:uncharacterized protein related to proFAR isomerase
MLNVNANRVAGRRSGVRDERRPLESLTCELKATQRFETSLRGRWRGAPRVAFESTKR